MQNLSSIYLGEVKRETRQVPNFPGVLQCIGTGWDIEQQRDSALSRWCKLREELSSVDGLPLRGGLLVSSLSLRRRFIDLTQDIARMRRYLRRRFWWPKMNVVVDAYIKNCHACHTNAKTVLTAASPL